MRKIWVSLFVMVLSIFSNPAYAAELEEGSGGTLASATVEVETIVEKIDVESDTGTSFEKVAESTLNETLKSGEEMIQAREDDVGKPDQTEKIPLETESVTDKINVDLEKQLMVNKESETGEGNGLAVTQTDPFKEKVEEKNDKMVTEDDGVTLKEGTTLDARTLAEKPVILGGSEGLADLATPTVEVLVSSFEELKAAIEKCTRRSGDDHRHRY